MRQLPLSLVICFLLQSADNSPQLLPRNIVNAADYSSGHVAPGEIVVLFPTNAGPDTLLGAHTDADGRVTTLLGETRVWFDGIAAPISYTSRRQVSAVVPYEVAGRQTTEIVVEYQRRRSPPVSLPVVESAPALFTLDSSGKGQAAMLNEPGCCNSAANPAIRGTVSSLYATGAGQTNPPGVNGSVYAGTPGHPAPRLPVRVTVGGKAAEILYAGAAPHAIAGLLQVNFRVPDDAPAGDAVPLVLTVGDRRSQDGVTMAVRSRVQRVLVSDAEAATRDWFRRVLGAAGYQVLAARNRGEALAKSDVDLVILDAEESADTVRAMQAKHPRILVAATARSMGPKTLRAADLLGAQAVLRKPLEAGPVLQRVRELLRLRSAVY